jgi:hypothetical protein
MRRYTLSVVKVNPKVNAIFSLQVEKALEQVNGLDNKISKGEKIGALLPQINTLVVTDFI